MAGKIDRTVVRNQAYQSGAFNVRERHNERKNECYGNGDIIPERSNLNIHFKQLLNPDGTPETYEAAFNRMLLNGEISKRGLKPDAKIFDELVFDVNSAYFEERGGYEYAKSFFEEAYRLAVKEIGGERFILSAVMHADERNKALSDELGKDVFHYHLHVSYIPVVQKEVYFRKNNKNPELAGKLKEVITQVSHSKKWPIRLAAEKNGKTLIVNAYSLLQDRFFEHMRAAGFDGFERGERGSTAEHLSDLEYKTDRETERLGKVAAAVQEQRKAMTELTETVKNLTEKAEIKKKQIAAIDNRLISSKMEDFTFSEIEQMGKPTLFGGKVELASKDWESITALAKKGILSASQISDLKRKLADMKKDADIYRARLETLQSDVKPLLDALKHAPDKVSKLIAEIMSQPSEKAIREHDRAQKKQHTMEVL